MDSRSITVLEYGNPSLISSGIVGILGGTDFYYRCNRAYHSGMLVHNTVKLFRGTHTILMRSSFVKYVLKICTQIGTGCSANFVVTSAEI